MEEALAAVEVSIFPTDSIRLRNTRPFLPVALLQELARRGIATVEDGHFAIWIPGSVTDGSMQVVALDASGGEISRQAFSTDATVARGIRWAADHGAQVVNMSAFYFCKSFKKATGMTFTEYLARVRVEKVKNLLLNPNLRVSEIAFEVGFQCPLGGELLGQRGGGFRQRAGAEVVHHRLADEEVVVPGVLEEFGEPIHHVASFRRRPGDSPGLAPFGGSAGSQGRARSCDAIGSPARRSHAR